MDKQAETMSDIRVWPGIVIKKESDKVTLALGHFDGETQEAYVQRCQQIASFAVRFVPNVEPYVDFDFSDTSKYRKVGENSYEIVTPGYMSPEEQPSERDTHFASWAASVWDELHTLSTRKIDEADKERYEAMDKEILARAGYDLVRYAIDAIKPHIYTNTFTPDTQDEIFKSIPDMTARPEQDEVHTEEG